MVIKLKGSCLKVKKECGKFVRVVFVVLVAVAVLLLFFTAMRSCKSYFPII
jgi:hypothetical protein